MRRSLLVVAFICTVGCSDSKQPGTQPQIGSPLFKNVAATLGVNYSITTGASKEHYLVETMLGGVGWLDYDGDGDYDLYITSGHKNARLARQPGTARNALYQNNGAKGFQDVTAAAGVGDQRYSHGVAVGDYDNDGDSDLLVTNFGRNTLYENNGSGKFIDVTQRAGLTAEGYNMSAAWLDFDRDGDLDLYVVRYLEYWPETARPCHNLNRRGYCHPRLFSGQPDLLYRNEGGGRFTDVSQAAGIARAGDVEGKGLGVIAADLDHDGWIDLYIANDTTANFLWRNNQNGTFTDMANEWGVALSEDGEAQAGMGIDWADLNADGIADIHVTNFSDETNNLYLSTAPGHYVDGVHQCRLGDSFKLLGFGTAFLDVELDGELDLVVANGHVDDSVELTRKGAGVLYRQRPALYRNAGGGRFSRDIVNAGATFLEQMVGRGLATADFDNDGDTDFALAPLDRRLALLRNDNPARGNYLQLRLIGTKSPRDAYGARVTARVGDKTHHFDYHSTRSYLSACDPRIIIGLGSATVVDELTIHWPSGAVEKRTGISANQQVTVTEGE